MFGGEIVGFRKAREKAGLTVLQAARQLETSTVTVYNWENGVYTPEAHKLTRIAKLYNCTIDELLLENESAGI